MKITLKNIELSTAIEFLDSMNLKPKESRHRSKFISLLKEAYEAFKAEEIILLKDFDLLNENEMIKPSEECLPKNVTEFNKHQRILHMEEVVIEGGMFARNFQEIPSILESYSEPLIGDHATIYDRLMDEFEKEGTAEWKEGM